MKTQMKTLLIALSLIALLYPVTLTAVKAQQIPPEIPTFLLLSVAPNPVGVRQTVYINVFFSKPMLTTGLGGSGDRYENVTVVITRPDGGKDTLGPKRADAVGGVWLEYKPQQVGEYHVQAFYPGQHIERWVYPFIGTPYYVNTTYLPANSEVVTLIVQEAPIGPIYKTPPLPKEYWSRPIYATNWEWAQLGGSWFGLAAPAFATTGMYDATGNFNPYSKAPNTAHILWVKPTHFGGQVGLPISADQMSQYMSTTIATSYFEPLILNGILYYTHFAGPTAQKASWVAVDIRTGEILWTRKAGETGNEVFRMGQILRYHSIQEYGSWAFLYSSPSAAFFGAPTFFGIYDPMTGVWLANITGVQNIPFLMDFETEQQGTILGYYISGGNLTRWNSTKLMMSKSFDKITIRPSGTYDWSSGIDMSVPIPKELNGVPISLSIAARTPEVILLRYAAGPGMFIELSYGWQVTAGMDAKTGALLWGPINQTLPYLHDIALLTARDGVYILHDKDTDEAYGYSLKNGQKLWGPVKLPGNAWSHISRAAQIAYGKVFIWDYGGYVNALNLTTGEILWTFSRGSAGYDTPYGIYPLWHFGTHSIADGKLFLSEGHMYDPPLHPAYRLAIDCDTGELVWKLLSFSGRCPGAIADGYLIQWNSFDSQIYSIGKGPSAVRITTQEDVVALGDKVLIKGVVTDESPGTKDSDRTARFPNGVPAVADADMSPWMEYVYMQQPIPESVGGVDVELYAVYPDGSYKYIDTVSTDPLNGGVFRLLWEPPEEGAYIIVALFRGSESYWPSYASTAIGVTAAPPETATAEQAGTMQSTIESLQSAVQSLQPLTIALAVLVIIAIIIGAFNLYALRKLQK
ncbi:MAG: PQQ-binding-like beta-propeller repeat protein [Candidatus Bathyarchaeia archaeon]